MMRAKTTKYGIGMKQKIVVFSQIDAEVLQRLEQRYHVVVINPKAGDVNTQIREQVADADAHDWCRAFTESKQPRNCETAQNYI